MAWTDVDEKNNFKGKINNIESKFFSALSELNKITKKNLDIPNIATIYRSKMFELEEQFAQKGINLFDRVTLRLIIDNYFINLTEKSIILINKISERLKLIQGMFLFNVTSILANKIIENLIKEYMNVYFQIKEFNIKEDISLPLIDFLSNKEYYIFTPGEYIKTYEQTKIELEALGFSDMIPDLDKKILPLIKKQEIATSNFNNNEIQNDKHK